MLLAASFLVSLAAAPRPRQERVTTETERPPLSIRVNRAMAWGVDYLRKQQRPDGSFSGHEGDHPGGQTSLAALALIRAGVRRSDPSLVRALEALEGVRFRSTYSSAVHLMLCEALGGEEYTALAQTDLDFLVEHQDQGLWAYPWGHLCGSNTQFAMMGLRAAHRMGLEVPEKTLIDAAEGIWRLQHRSGGFVYDPNDGGGKPYSGMTAAGLASLAVLEEIGADSRFVRKILERRVKDRRAAEEWLAERFDPTRNGFENGSWTPFWHSGYMWSLERWCGLTGRETFAGVDWYEVGAEWLLENQAPDGSMSTQEWNRFEDTCLALFFLRRATISGGELDELYAELDRERSKIERPPERAGPGARRLTSWWLAGPWQGSREDELLLDPPFSPGKVRPRDRGRVARETWRRVELKPDGWTNLDQEVGPDGDHRLWLLATFLTWEPEHGDSRTRAWLWLELEDGWDVWLDGERLSREHRVRAPIVGDVGIPLELDPGEHRLVILVEDEHGAAAFGALLGGPENGPPPDGLLVGPDPPKDG